MYNMQCVNLEDVDYPWDEFTERTDIYNGCYTPVYLSHADRRLVGALRKAGITDDVCLVYISW